jgi:DNA polymerase-3 subunit epsilon
MVLIKESDFVTFDTETTGVDTEKDRIIEFGAAIYEAGTMTSRGHVYFNPGMPIPIESTKIHRITDARVANKPGFETFVDRLKKKFDSVGLISGFNCLGFDLPLLASELARVGCEWRPSTPVLDVKTFVDWYHRGERPRTQEAISRIYGVHADGSLHSAAVDSQLTGQLLYAMIDAGKIPDDVDEALAVQARYKAIIDKEFEDWSYWIYRCRETRRLRMGAGKHCGKLVTEVPKSYIGYLLNLDDLHDGARAVMRDAHAGKIQNELQQPMISTPEDKGDKGWGGW